jgi:hypothetical protein
VEQKKVLAYRKYHGCDTALLTLSEHWKRELDNHKSIGLVSMDLSKAFDTLSYDLIISKLKHYGVDHNTVKLISSYLSNRYQRVKLSDHYSTWQQIEAGVPQGSILGPLHFNIFMNDLAYVVKNCDLSAYADDTQIFSADTNPLSVETTINEDLARVDEWYMK